MRDYPFVASGRPPLTEIDLRAECSPIKNQGRAGACTAFQAVGHAERLTKRAGKLPIGGFSERANYDMSRQLLGFTGDSGASLRASIHAGYKYGIPTGATFPYTDDPAAIADLTVPDPVMAEAQQHRFDAYYRIAPDYRDETVLARQIDRALADGFTVGIGIYLHYWFYYVWGPLSVHEAYRHNPLKGKESVWTAPIGAHAMVIVGRSDSLGGYIVRNSWDTNWGDHGYYLMPFADLGEAFEWWVVAGFAGCDVKPAAYDLNCAESVTARLYRAALNRYPDAGGLAWHAGTLAAAGPATVAGSFLASAEYAAAHPAGKPDDATFVTQLYRNALGRDPDADGLQYWVGALGAGEQRATLLASLADSPEARAREIPVSLNTSAKVPS